MQKSHPEMFDTALSHKIENQFYATQKTEYQEGF